MNLVSSGVDGGAVCSVRCPLSKLNCEASTVAFISPAQCQQVSVLPHTATPPTLFPAPYSAIPSIAFPYPKGVVSSSVARRAAPHPRRAAPAPRRTRAHALTAAARAGGPGGYLQLLGRALLVRVGRLDRGQVDRRAGVRPEPRAPPPRPRPVAMTFCTLCRHALVPPIEPGRPCQAVETAVSWHRGFIAPCPKSDKTCFHTNVRTVTAGVNVIHQPSGGQAACLVHCDAPVDTCRTAAVVVISPSRCERVRVTAG